MAVGEARLFNIDVLRGLAVALVLIRHQPLAPGTNEPIAAFLRNAGWIGVDLFFVLSGFLISGLLYTELSRTGSIRLRRFWLRRGLKIWPSYFCIYGLFVTWRALLADKPVRLTALLANVFFVQNYFPKYRWPSSWSLAVEEHFYLLLPLLLLVLSRSQRGLRLLPPIAASACVVILLARFYWSAAPGVGWQDLYLTTHFRADSLLFGALVGYGYHHHRTAFERVVARAWPVLLAAATAVVVFAGTYRLGKDGTLPHTLGFTLLYLGFGGAVMAAVAYPRVGEWNPLARAMAWLGLYSYTVYLVQSVVPSFPHVGAVPALLRQHAVDSPWVNRCFFWLISIAGGYAASHLIERPFLRLRRRWFPAGGT